MGFFTPDEMTQDIFDGKAMCHFEIERADVEGNDFERIDTFFEELRELGTAPRQKVWFSFAGYDDDKRELIYSLAPGEVRRVSVYSWGGATYNAKAHNGGIMYVIKQPNKWGVNVK